MKTIYFSGAYFFSCSFFFFFFIFVRFISIQLKLNIWLFAWLFEKIEENDRAMCEREWMSARARSFFYPLFQLLRPLPSDDDNYTCPNSVSFFHSSFDVFPLFLLSLSPCLSPFSNRLGAPFRFLHFYYNSHFTVAENLSPYVKFGEQRWRERTHKHTNTQTHF